MTETKEAEMRIMDTTAVRSAIDLPTAIDLVAEALRAAAEGRFSVPQRAVLADGRALAMVAGRSDDPGIVWKVLSSVSANAEHGLPTIQGTVLWADDETGAVTAMLDGEAMTVLRTAAVTGLALRRLAPPQAAVLGLLGAGAQAPGLVRAALTVRDLREVRVWSRTAERAEALAHALEPEFPAVRFRPVSESSDVVRGADAVIAATRAVEPLVHARDLSERATVLAIGAYRPDMIEVDPSVFACADVVVADDVTAALAESGDMIRAVAKRALRTEDVSALGAWDAGARGGAGIRVFKSVGTAALDWAIAAAAYRRAGRPEPTGGTT